MIKFKIILIALITCCQVAFGEGRIRNAEIHSAAAIAPSKIASGTFSGTFNGNAATCSAFDHTPAQCPSGEFQIGQEADGDAICAEVDSFPDQTSHGGEFLTTDGSAVSWSAVPGVVPSGGLMDYALIKSSGADYEFVWSKIFNANLSNMTQGTIKGRAAGAGTGTPTDLTATQATEILNAFTGDSGSGGVKGLVPAPASGDAAAGKFLKSDGTWELPSGGSGEVVAKEIEQTGHGLSVGDWVYFDGADYVEAQADDEATAEIVGVVSAVADANNFTLTMGGYVSGLSGFTAGETYWLSDATPGALTATEPSTVGHLSCPVFVADSTTSGFVKLLRCVVIAAAAGLGGPKSIYVLITNSGTPAVSIEGGDALSENVVGTLVDEGNGDVTVPFVAGVFASGVTPVCNVTPSINSSNRNCFFKAQSSASVRVVCEDTTDGTDFDMNFNLTCTGPRP